MGKLWQRNYWERIVLGLAWSWIDPTERKRFCKSTPCRNSAWLSLAIGTTLTSISRQSQVCGDHQRDQYNIGFPDTQGRHQESFPEPDCRHEEYYSEIKIRARRLTATNEQLKTYE
jgi:hypothetical protein